MQQNLNNINAAANESATKTFNLDSIDPKNFTAEELKYVKEQAAVVTFISRTSQQR